MWVNGVGSLDSKIWLMGEAPGSNEIRQDIPFVGGAGRVLDSMLQEVGIKRTDCYIDNIIRICPPGGTFNSYYHDKSKTVPTDELKAEWVKAQELIAKHKPNVVVAFGNEALVALTGKRAITKWRGSVLECRGVKVIPMLHPSMVMRMWSHRPECIIDLNRIKEEAKTPEFIKYYTDNLIINPKYDDVMHHLTEFLPKQEYIAFDIETQQRQITCMGLGWSKQDSICIPIFYGGNSWWNEAEEYAIISAMRKLFHESQVKFIAQNAQYDMVYIMDKWGIDVPKLWMDTMIAFHCVYPELRKSLAFLTSIYTHRPYYKDMGVNPDTLWHYNCLDTVATWECAMEINQDLKDFKTHDFYRTHSHLLIRPAIKMQRYGVKINMPKRAELKINFEAEDINLQTKLNSVVGHELNPNSSKQMKAFLYEELKLPIQRKRTDKGMVVTADAEAIENLSKVFPNPVFSLILDIRKVRKLLSTYINVALDADNRIRCNYMITGTVTGRLSSRESVYGTGTNLQNISRDPVIRSMFIADKGMKFVNADLSQAEAWIVAYISQDIHMQAVFNKGGDVHTTNATKVFKKRAEEILPAERQLAKALVHAANYGIGSKKFAKIAGISVARADGLLNTHYALYPGIKRWHLEVDQQIKRARILRTPLGRARMFFDRWSPHLLNEALAYVPQSTVADLLNLGIIRSAGAFPPNWTLLMQVHDSVLIQMPEDAHPLHIYRFIKHYFENSLEIYGKRFTIPVDIKVGKNWGQMKKLEVEL